MTIRRQLTKIYVSTSKIPRSIFLPYIAELDINMEVMDFLKESWNTLVSPYTASRDIKTRLFEEIITHYSSKNRHYHNLTHLKSLLESANLFKNSIGDHAAIGFAIFYHDIVYSSTSSKNEELSADLASKRVMELGTEESLINKVKNYILATKNHMKHISESDEDLQFFLDFDLKILGSSREEYKVYMNQIRNEYRLIPDILYNPGRKKVLKQFLEVEHIFKTEIFRKTYESQAKANLEFEISQL